MPGWSRRRTCGRLGGAGADTSSACRCTPGGKIDTEVLSRRGRYREGGPNLRVKEVMLGEGERWERYAVCHNPREAERRRRHRALLLVELAAKLAAKLAALPPKGEGEHGKRVCSLRGQPPLRALPAPDLHRRARDRSGPGEGGRAAGREVRRAYQRRHAERRGHGAWLPATTAGRAGVAADEERPRTPPGLSPCRAPHPGPHRADGPRAPARADGRACARGHLAQHPPRSRRDQARSIVPDPTGRCGRLQSPARGF